jgi:hypothetical protein
MKQYEDSDSDNEEGREDADGNPIFPVGNNEKREYKKCVHDYLTNPTTDKQDTGTMMFPGGRDLQPKRRVHANSPLQILVVLLLGK